MHDVDRFKLLGIYETPRVRIGQRLTCEVRDCDVVVVGYSEGRIPWPLGRRPYQAAKAMIVSGDLADAIRRESNQAICFWFGVTGQTVSKWRKSLGVGLTNEGTHRLRSAYTDEPWAVEARAKAHAKTGDPERCAKISAAKRGKPRPTPPGWVPNGTAWTAEADEWVQTLPPKEAARRTCRTLAAVYRRRWQLKHMGSEVIE
jgi:hypothetical protein